MTRSYAGINLIRYRGRSETGTSQQQLAPPEVCRTIGKNRALAKTFRAKMNSVGIAALSIFILLSSAHSSVAEPLTLDGSRGRLTVEVEVADTGEKRQTGLMHRTELGRLNGMLFDFKRVQPVSMWMKNTLIPLDMIFADHRGRIVYIKEAAQPGDLSIVRSSEPVLAVLEMRGGFVRQYHVQVGDRLIHPIFAE